MAKAYIITYIACLVIPVFMQGRLLIFLGYGRSFMVGILSGTIGNLSNCPELYLSIMVLLTLTCVQGYHLKLKNWVKLSMY